jgi:hypothetical protein
MTQVWIGYISKLTQRKYFTQKKRIMLLKLWLLCIKVVNVYTQQSTDMSYIRVKSIITPIPIVYPRFNSDPKFQFGFLCDSVMIRLERWVSCCMQRINDCYQGNIGGYAVMDILWRHFFLLRNLKANCQINLTNFFIFIFLLFNHSKSK